MGNVSTSIAHAGATFRHFQEACNRIVSETKHQEFEMFAETVSSYNYDDPCYFQFPREWGGGMSKDLRPLDGPRGRRSELVSGAMS